MIRITLAPANATRAPLPPGKPSWVQFGPYGATMIERHGNTVNAEINLPADAAVGVLLDCHLEFDPPNGRGPVVFKQNDAFRVVE